MALRFTHLFHQNPHFSVLPRTISVSSSILSTRKSFSRPLIVQTIRKTTHAAAITTASPPNHRSISMHLKKGSPSTAIEIAYEPEAEDGVSLEFFEEPLGLTVEQGFGFADLDYNQRIGPDGRFEIKKKLGWGMYSSVWMTKDLHTNSYVAVKALTGKGTVLINKGTMQELRVLERLRPQVSISPPSLEPGPNLSQTSEDSHSLVLSSSFTLEGKRPTDGTHLCFVTDLMGGDVQWLRKMQHAKGDGKEEAEKERYKVFSISFTKRIVRDVLKGLKYIHERGVFHTDLKPENIFLRHSLSQEELEAIASRPLRRHPPEQSWNVTVQVAVSEPLPCPSVEEAEKGGKFLVGDFGSAQLVDDQTYDEFCPPLFRPPEAILKGPLDTKVDIWMLGCNVWSFLTGSELFKLEPPSDGSISSSEEWHLHQMMCMTCTRFYPEQLMKSGASLEYFDPTTSLLKSGKSLVRSPISAELKNYDLRHKMTEDERNVAGAFITRCLSLDPEQRPTANELLEDPWLQS